MADLIFYTNPMSRARTVRWMLEEVGAPYETVVMTFGPEMKSSQFLAINPMGKVPAIVHRGVPVTEGAAICAYLADAFPAAGLAPAHGAPERAAYYRWMFYAAGPLETAATNAAFGWVAKDAKQEGPLGYGSLGRVEDTLEQVLKGEGWLAGAAFTAADLYLAAQLGFLMQFDLISSRDAFKTFVDRAQSRPAAIRAREIDNALMPEQPGGASAGS
ncbi:MAG: glutathione S-transferase family protein [Pseudomonadota bacterium]